MSVFLTSRSHHSSSSTMNNFAIQFLYLSSVMHWSTVDALKHSGATTITIERTRETIPEVSEVTKIADFGSDGTASIYDKRETLSIDSPPSRMMRRHKFESPAGESSTMVELADKRGPVSFSRNQKDQKSSDPIHNHNSNAIQKQISDGQDNNAIEQKGSTTTRQRKRQDVWTRISRRVRHNFQSLWGVVTGNKLNLQPGGSSSAFEREGIQE